MMMSTTLKAIEEQGVAKRNKVFEGKKDRFNKAVGKAFPVNCQRFGLSLASHSGRLSHTGLFRSLLA